MVVKKRFLSQNTEPHKVPKVRDALPEITELLFADDGVIVYCTRQGMEEAARVFDEVIAEFGLTMSVVKTKLLVAGSNLEEGDLQLPPLYIRGQLVEQVQSLKYLGSFVDASGSVALD